MKQFELHGHTALVTGASRGIGAAIELGGDGGMARTLDLYSGDV